MSPLAFFKGFFGSMCLVKVGLSRPGWTSNFSITAASFVAKCTLSLLWGHCISASTNRLANGKSMRKIKTKKLLQCSLQQAEADRSHYLVCLLFLFCQIFLTKQESFYWLFYEAKAVMSALLPHVIPPVGFSTGFCFPTPPNDQVWDRCIGHHSTQHAKPKQLR